MEDMLCTVIKRPARTAHKQKPP